MNLPEDPLWKLRHAISGVALALLLSVPLAALAGRWIGQWLGEGYGWRAGVYTVLLVYLLAGAVALFVKLARHETRALDARRVGLWLVSLWLWPLLLATRRRR